MGYYWIIGMGGICMGRYQRSKISSFFEFNIVLISKCIKNMRLWCLAHRKNKGKEMKDSPWAS